MSHFETKPPLTRRPVGTWRLHPGHAMGLRPRQAAVLRVFCGRVWVTLGVHGQAGAAGDRFLGPGSVLYVPAGARLVMEPVFMGGDTGPVHFDWSDQVVAPGRFAREVVRPAGDLVTALMQAGAATLQVVKGLLGYGEFLVTGRGKVASGLDASGSWRRGSW